MTVRMRSLLSVDSLIALGGPRKRTLGLASFEHRLPNDFRRGPSSRPTASDLLDIIRVESIGRPEYSHDSPPSREKLRPQY